METQDESDLLKLLEQVLRDSVYEISDFEDVDLAATRLLAQALDLGLIRDDGAGRDNGARYVLTNDGRRALGLQTDWWMPEDLRGKLSAVAETAPQAQGGGARPHPSVIVTTVFMRRSGTRHAILQYRPAICLIVVICGIILITLAGMHMISN